MKQYISFRDLEGSLVHFKRDSITAIVIKSPLNNNPAANTVIACGVVASQVTAQTAAEVLKELETPGMKES